ITVHLVKELPQNPAGEFVAAINVDSRRKIAANHTATHLLHQALRQVLGTHVEQKGSYVSADSLRFDFSHFQKLTPEELRKVEHLANKYVRQATSRCEYRDMPIDEARGLGAMALFGEKYGDKVRVIKYDDSVELCGGTHVANTGEIGMIRILSESSIAAGIRRIEAITGEAVEDCLDEATYMLQGIAAMFNNAPDIKEAIRKAIEENAELKRQAQEALLERSNVMAAELLVKAREIGGIKVAALQGVRLPDVVKNIAMAIRRDSPQATAFVAATKDPSGKPLLTVALTDDLVSQGMNAAQIARNAARSIKGGGGGQPGFAQAGGKDPEGLSAAFDAMMSAF
ncbi:MAG: DHHA1 domain-containing protein, partial [Bacteroidales bacterium]|nr:DHHA1 domain-containing protein [Bacteroidales bacterium]